MWDDLINLWPAWGQSGNIATGAAAGPVKRLGKNRTYRVWGRCGGDVTGAGATLGISVEESADGATGWTVIAGPMNVTEQVGAVSATIPRPEVPSGVATLPWLIFTTSKDYVRMAAPTLGGTTPVFPAVSVKAEPVDAPHLASGR
jgi:hypothetical protein